MRVRTRIEALGLASALLVVLFGIGGGSARGARPALDEASLPPTSAKDQLSAAWAVKKRSFRKEDPERRSILLEAVGEYRKVRDRFPDDRQSCALAAFRIGEIYRTLKERSEAEKAFREVLTFSDQPQLVARAFLELGHLERRDKEWDLAVELYGQVVRQCPQERDRGAMALVWTAKCHRVQKRFVEAREALRRVVDEYDEQTKRVLDAYDLLAVTYLDEGEIATAAGVLEECESRFAALEASGDDVHRGAVARVKKLSAWKKLREARAKASAEGAGE